MPTYSTNFSLLQYTWHEAMPVLVSLPSLLKRLHVSRREALLLCLILILAIGVRFWGIRHSVYTDEVKVVLPSMQLAKGEQTPLLYPKGSYYPHFYHYILGGIFLPIALLYPERSFDNPYNNTYLFVGRVTTASLGVLTVLLLFFFGRRLTGTRTALIAALFLALIPAHVKYSHYAHVDVPLTFFMLLVFFSALRVWETGARRWYILTGLLVGVTGAVQYTGFTAGIALVFAHIAYVYRQGFALQRLLGPIFLFSLVLIPLGFFLVSPYSAIDWRETVRIYKQTSLRASAGDLGHTRLDILWPLYTRSPDWGIPFTSAGILWEFNPFLTALALAGFLLAIVKKQWNMAVLVGTVTIVVYLAITGYVQLTALKRYVVLAPFVSLLAASLLTSRWDRTARMARGIQSVVAVALVLGITVANFWNVAAFNAAYARGATHPAAVAWATEHLPEGTVILQHGPIRLLPPDSTRFRVLSLNEVYANFRPDDPETAYDRAKPLDEWVRNEQVDVVYLDGRLVDRYVDPTTMKLYPETTASYRAFYTDVRTRGRLLYEASPVPWNIAGPRIEIYDVRHLRAVPAHPRESARGEARGIPRPAQST